MGERTGSKPSSHHSYMWRICHALDASPHELCGWLDIRWRDMKMMLREHKRARLHQDETDAWYKIHDYVNRRLGELMAVKVELDRDLGEERSARLMRHERIRNRRGPR